MAENPKLFLSQEDMGSDTRSTSCKACELDKTGTEKISVSDQANSLEFTNFKSDSFIVDMDRLSHLTNKDMTAHSRITRFEKLQRTLSRKVPQQRGNEKKISPSIGNEKENRGVAATSSPRAALAGGSMPEKAMVVTLGTTDPPMNPQVHHQITIMTGNNSATTAESRCSGKKISFRRSPPASWAINPRRIVFLFATVSSIGTILLIYFTLSIGKLSGDDSTLNW